jgi:hypothetical protein
VVSREERYRLREMLRGHEDLTITRRVIWSQFSAATEVFLDTGGRSAATMTKKTTNFQSVFQHRINTTPFKQFWQAQAWDDI